MPFPIKTYTFAPPFGDNIPLSGASDVRPKSASVFPYYDLDRCAWRSFDIRNFIGFVEPVDQPTSTPVDR